MNAIVLYESMYGNTGAIAEAIADGLGGARLMSPADLATDAPPPDLLVVGGPTHVHGMASARSRRAAREAARHPEAVTAATSDPALRDWLADLPDTHDARAAAFDTRLNKPEWVTGAASHGIAKRLRQHGYKVLDTSSFLVTDSEGPLLEGELERARRWGTELAASVPAPVADAEVAS